MYEEHSAATRINADIALKNRLYVSGWCLSGNLVDVRDSPEDCLVLVHYEDERAVGVCLVQHYEVYNKKVHNIQTFVKKSYRGKGIGRQLVNKAKEITPNAEFSYGAGIAGSRVFWEKVLDVKEMKYDHLR